MLGDTTTLFAPVSASPCLGVLAFGSPLSKERAALGFSECARRGIRLKMPLDVSRDYGKYEHGFANGSVTERLDAFKQLVEDPEVEAILSARGGYGLMELLPKFTEPWLREHRKPIIGLSDTTVLLAQWRNGFAAPMIHGPCLGDCFADAANDAASARSVDSLCALLQKRPWNTSFAIEVLRQGTAEGPLLVGNLTMLRSLLGTPWDPAFDGALVVLEDVGESPFQIHRSLLQLTLAGKFERVAGVVFGRFAKCSAPYGPNLDQVLQLVLSGFWSDYSFPVAKGLPVGHWGENHALPLGVKAVLHEGRLRVEGH